MEIPGTRTGSDSSGVSASASNLKRRRNPLACRTCRSRKTRCDGKLPACTFCATRGSERSCIYETRGEYTYGAHPGAEPSVIPEKRRRQSLLHAPGGSIQDLMPGSESSPQAVFPGDSRIAPILSRRLGGTPYYGGASASALVKQMKMAASYPHGSLLTTVAEGEPVGNRYGESAFASRPEILREQDLTSIVLPPRDTADDLLHCYWECSHPVFPVLHRGTFMIAYRRLWTPSNHNRVDELDALGNTHFYVMLNVAFAIGCHFSEKVRPADKSSKADDFYQRSRKLVNLEILDSVQQATVQMLLLTAVYLWYEQPKTYVDRCWNVVGLAIRAAQGAGLDSSDFESHQATQLDCEINRRIWHCLMTMDRLLSMTSGRPTMASRLSSVKLPSVIDDGYLLQEGQGVQPSNTPSRMSAFVHTLKLFDILEEVLTVFYNHRDKRSLASSRRSHFEISDHLSQIIIVDAKLVQFSNTVPENLRPPFVEKAGGSYDRCIRMQAVILQNRFLYTRLLLFRPVLIASVTAKGMLALPSNRLGESSLQDGILRHMCEACLHTAYALIDTLYENTSGEDRVRTQAWHNGYYTFSVALIFIIAHMSPLVEADFHDQRVNTSWSRCMTMLDQQQEQIPSSIKAKSFLEASKLRAVGAPSPRKDEVNGISCDRQAQDNAQSLPTSKFREDESSSFDASYDPDLLVGQIDDDFLDQNLWDLGITGLQGLEDVPWPTAWPPVSD